jgi:hypothetical protein
MALPDDVRSSCAQIAARADSVRIDVERLEQLDPGPAPALDPAHHYLDGPPEDVATYLLTLDAINFGSGWFPTLRKRSTADGRPLSGYFTVASALAERFRARGPWTNPQLRAITSQEVAAVLGQRPDHELVALYAQALRELGRFLGDRHTLDLVASARGSAVHLAASLADGMATWHDVGFFKRAQIAASDLALGGVATFADLDALTIFADNLVPHVLRCDGVLVYDERLAAHIDAGRPLRMGPQEREIRACAVHACALIAERVGMSERDIDNALWTRGQGPAYKARPRHRCRTVFY